MTAASIAKELREGLENVTPGPWKWWTSNSWRRLRRDDHGISMSVLEPFVSRADGHPDLDGSEEDMAHIARCSPDRIATLIEAFEAMGEALKPFANIAEMESKSRDGASVFVNVSRCRDAAAALAKAGL